MRVVYQEVLDNETAAALNVAAVQNAVLSYRMVWPQRLGVPPYGSATSYAGVGNESPPPVVHATYTAQIADSSLTGDTDAEVLYRETLKPWLLAHLKTVLNLDAHPEAASKQLVTQDESWQWSPSVNSFNGMLTVMVPRNAAQITMYRESIYQLRDLGWRREKLWDRRANTYSSWSIGERTIARQTITMTRLNTLPVEPPLLGGNWQLDTHDRQDSAERVGSPAVDHGGGELHSAIEYTSQFQRTYTLVDHDAGATGSAITPGPETVVYQQPPADLQGFVVAVGQGGTTVWAQPRGD